jgi:hypothetical protein
MGIGENRIATDRIDRRRGGEPDGVLIMPSPAYASVLVDHPDTRLKHLEERGIGHATHQTWFEVELTGDHGSGAVIKIEVDFIQTWKGSAPSWDDPGSADEFEIVAVRPFETKRLSTGFMGTERHYLPCPNWLLELLTECVDASDLRAGD